MKLYDSRRAPNPRRVRWFMTEKGIDDIEVVDVDLLAGAHRSPEYVGRAGIAQSPALTMDDGTTITESIAICRYLESLYPEPNLFGQGPKETAVIEMWMRRAELLCAMPLMLAVRHGHPALAALETQVPEVGANNRAQAERSLKLFDKRLAESPWIGGERITIADGVLFIGMDFARMVRFQPPEALTNLGRWLSAMRERASASAGV
ncbi:MAG TPA: glutathione S-transferase [Caulobacteraceae bacterium]|nr:glutathione S-transferase [Caulobacteraceae bacterium]